MSDITKVDRLNAEIADLKRIIEWYQGRTGIMMGAAAEAALAAVPASEPTQQDHILSTVTAPVSQHGIVGGPVPAKDQAFYQFWYGHMVNEQMTGELANISHSTARHIWDAATSCHAEVTIQALELAMTICDGVSNRAHNSKDRDWQYLGRLVNACDGGAHGYAVIRDALANLKSRAAPAAAPAPVSGMPDDVAVLRNWAVQIERMSSVFDDERSLLCQQAAILLRRIAYLPSPQAPDTPNPTGETK